MNKRIRKKRGIYTKFKDSETWGLYMVIAQFILPRLKRFKKLNNGVPMSLFFDKEDKIHGDDVDWQDRAAKEWDSILDEMIWSFEQIVDDSDPEKLENETNEEYVDRCRMWNNNVQHGLELFAKYFLGLWW